MKRITPLSLTFGATLALAASLGVIATAMAEPNPMPNSAVVKTRIYNDCPTSTVTVTNNYPASISITDAHLDCFGFANLHNWKFSENGTTPAEWDNNSGFRFGADVIISGTGDGEAGLLMSPWFATDTDGRFNIRTPDGEIACFGGRLPFYTFSGAPHNIHYVKGETIHLAIEYDPHSLSSTKPATIIYTVVYHGTTYSSGELPFDQGNASEDPPHGQYGDLNTTQIGGYFQPRLANGTDVTTTATFTGAGIQYTTTPEPNSAVVKTRIFNDCPTSTVTVTNNYPTQIAIEDSHLDCFGFANLHNWQFSENGTAGANFNNDSRWRYSTDLVISGTGVGEAGLLVSPWFAQDTDGKFNVRTPDGEIACFGGRLPFYTFTGAFGLHYVAGQTINLEIAYDPHGLVDGDGATITYNVIYQGTPYTSGPLPFDKGNVGEEPQHGVWGILNDARVGGYFQPRLANGSDLAVKATWGNIHFSSTCLTPIDIDAKFKPKDLNLKSKDKYVTVTLTPNAPHSATDIDASSVRVNGVPALTSPAPKFEHHGDTVRLTFSRPAVKATLTAGDHVPVLITGDIGADCFETTVYIKVKGPKIHEPHAAAVLAAGSTTDVQWDTSDDIDVQSVTLMSSLDDGVTWTVEADNLPNTGHYNWTVPQVQSGQARVSIVAIYTIDGDVGPVTESEFAVSDPFTINSTAGVGDASVSLGLRMANPVKGPLSVSFSLPTRQPATIAMYDVSGRQVASREVGSFGPGQHSVSLGARGSLRPGVYMVRLTQGSRSMTTRAVVIE